MKRGGFSLIEMLVVLAALAMLMGLSFTLLFGMVRTDRVGEGTLRRINRRAEIADQFRDDVHAAIDMPAERGEYRAGPTCLILKQGDASWVVYQAEPGRLIRIVQSGGTSTRTPIRLASEESDAEFSRIDGVARLRLTELVKHGTAKVAVIDAAIGGGR